MPEHVHVHAPHELTESAEHGPVSRRERTLELAAVLLLSIATVCIAWSGYQAAKWSGLQAHRYAQAGAAIALANRASTLAGQERLQDLLNFNRWLDASTSGNQKLENLYERRFRQEFQPAFRAWIAQDPLHNSHAVASPLLMPQYRPANFEKADKLDATHETLSVEAEQATQNSDDYIFVTVFFAAVLFFAGISMRFEWFPMRLSILVLSGCFLAYGLLRLAHLPTL